MLCNWSRAANISKRGLTQDRTPFTPTFRHGHRIASPVPLLTQPRISASLSNPLSLSNHAIHTTSNPREPEAALASKSWPAPFSPPPIFTSNSFPSSIRRPASNPESLTTEPISESVFSGKHTSAQISRATSTAIRLALQGDRHWDAFHLYHSVRWSWYHYGRPVRDGQTMVFRQPFKHFKPIDLGQAVHPKLACHTLVHGLVRKGEYRLAGKLVQGVMNDGVLRVKTFHAVIAALHSKMSVLPEDFRLPHIDRVKGKGAHIVTLGSILPPEPMTELAVLLLRGAHEHRWQRTQAMYDTTIKACLMQGEIIVASLLLALLIKEFKSKAARTNAADPTESAVQEELPTLGWSSRRFTDPRLSFGSGQGFIKSLSNVIQGIEDGIAQGPWHPQFAECSQSLAVLAGMLSRQELPTSRVARLIKALYSYPNNELEVWVGTPDGELTRKNAYKYFHSVLLDLVQSLSVRYAPRSLSRSKPLDIESYNALLHYSMRQRYSLELAGHVLNHMTAVRHPPLCPNVATYNILLRSSTLMRRNDIAAKVLSAIRDNLAAHGIKDRLMLPFILGPDPVASKEQTLPKHGSRNRNLKTAKLLEKILQGNLEVSAPQKQVEIDSVALCSYISHLTSTRDTDAVADILIQLFPELAGPADWPSDKRPYPEEVLGKHRQAWDESIQRAVRLGPYFFATVLNALCKGGRTGLCERVWYMAKKTEKASWETANPWNLSIDAYTSMMQCYAKEARKALGMRRMTPRGAEPTSNCVKENAIGWAPHEIKRREAVGRPEYRRHIIAVRLGNHLFNSVRRAAKAVHAGMDPTSNNGPRRPTHDLPIPDERFYNALLDVYGRAPNICARQVCPSHSHWRQRLRRAVRTYTDGEKSPYWRKILQKIVLEMHAQGFYIPVGFREMMAGAWPGAMPMDVDEREDPGWRRRRRHRLRRKIDIRPYAFPREPQRPKFRPHALQTVKTKGLPVPRK